MDSVRYAELYSARNEPFVPPTTDGYYAPLFQIFLGMAMGFIFAPFSLGLFIFLVVYLLLELWYALVFGFKYSAEQLSYRILAFVLALLAFFAGRILSGDGNPGRFHYDSWDF
jgi:hypothetical protein